MLWPSNRKRTAKNTANRSFAIPNEGGSCSGGGVVFESVVIGATSIANVAAVDPPFYDRSFPLLGQWPSGDIVWPIGD
jgi:hypothetical protein